jgi:uncharacterized membrane protein YvbJ
MMDYQCDTRAYFENKGVSYPDVDGDEVDDFVSYIQNHVSRSREKFDSLISTLTDEAKITF